ncbi:hypothetical protein [Anaerolinea sp.]|uniref:hypothetical protein n=1 Tax=Anaerolinea sp. TaxID=1872519 RepID=UPI002ACD4604|nr:hypothetical protein [Anaerolinea sp.]
MSFADKKAFQFFKHMWISIAQNGYFWFPLTIALFLRLRDFEQNSVWYDEALTIFLTRLPLFPMVRLISHELNPPLWEILEKLITSILSQQPWGYRIISLVSSLGILWVSNKILMFYRVQKDIRFMALTLLALLPYQIWMAQDARVYALMSYLYLQGFVFALERKHWGLWACSGLLLYSNSAAPFYVFTLLIIAFINHPEEWKKLFYVGVGTIITFSPWVFTWGKALSGGFFSGINVPEANFERLFFQLSYLFWIDNMSLLNFVLSMSGFIFIILVFSFFLFLQVFQRKQFPRSYWIGLFLLSIFPIISITLAGILYHSGHLMVYRAFSGASAGMVIFLAFLMNQFSRYNKIIFGLLITMSFLYLLSWSPTQKGGYLKEKLEILESNVHPTDVFYHATATSLLPFQFYLKEHSHYLLNETFPPGFMIPSFQEAFNLQKIPLEEIQARRVWIIYSRDAQLSSRIHERMGVYIRSARWMGKVEYPQAATIEIYLLER